MPRAIHHLAMLAACLVLAACASLPAPAGPGVGAPATTPASPVAATPRSDAPPAPGPADAAPGESPVALPAAPGAPSDGSPSDGSADIPPGPTEAELDYAALYGGAVYDPVADPAIPQPAELGEAYDPWEPFNRRIHQVNGVIDRGFARPLARAYAGVVPRTIRLGVGNFFRNLGQPATALNSLLQGRPRDAGQALARFLLNSTAGLAGFLDPATATGLPLHNEDFGQTLGVWGWERSRYVELPLFGPRTVRDIVGMAGDVPWALLRQVDEDEVRVFMQGLQLVDVRTQLFAADSMLEGAPDEYAMLRDAWLQRRDYLIFGDEQLEGDESLPEYLRDVENPTVPVDAMPVIPDGG